MRYTLKIDTQDEVTQYQLKQLVRFVLETAPREVIVTKVEAEDNQNGHKVAVERGDHQ